MKGKTYTVTAKAKYDDTKSGTVDLTVYDPADVPVVPTIPEGSAITELVGKSVGDVVAIDGNNWILLNFNESEAQLYAEGIMGGNVPFHNVDESSWKDSDLRDHMNSDTYIDAYFPTYKENLKTVTLTTKVDDNVNGSTQTTEDKVYLLTQEDLGFLPEDTFTTSPYTYPSVEGALVPSDKVISSGGFWLRSPQSETEVCGVNSIGFLGNMPATNATGGVRPALTVAL